MKPSLTLKLCILAALFSFSAVFARASAVLLLEEPFGHFGALTATGHAAVYLPRVCAITPVELRRCHDGEQGVVVSRYNNIAGYDWIAIPLVPYLYAVETADDVPLYANAKLEAFLRNQYRRKYLESVAPDLENGEPPSGHWVQLLGAAYDRTIYSYEIETSEEQDDALIHSLNTAPNRSRFRLLTRNCADFARQILNFYYPHTLHRSFIADLGVTTPKQLARTLVKLSKKRQDMEGSRFAVTRFVVPQVPGSVTRSTPVYGVLESFLKSKKYFFPLAAFHPVITGGMAIAYLGTGRFDPTKHLMVMDTSSRLHLPLDPNQREAYQDQLRLLMVSLSNSRPHGTTGSVTFVGENLKEKEQLRSWSRLQANAEPHLDSSGRPVLGMYVGAQVVNVGLTRENILNAPTPVLAQQILTYRLRCELDRGAASKTAATDVVNDWNLLRKVAPVKGLN